MERSNRTMAALFLLPTLSLYMLFLVIPLVLTVYTGFTDWDGINAPAFIGLDNYAGLVHDNIFRTAFRNTVYWVLAAVFIQLPISAVSAIILSKKIKGWKTFRNVLFFPALISGVTLGTMWAQGVYNFNLGALNAGLDALGLTSWRRDWLGEFDTAFASVLAAFVFYSGFYLIIIMAKISTIPSALYEAADIDGASLLQKERHITIPYIRSIYGTCVVLATIVSLKTFEHVYAMTSGGPANTSTNLAYYMYTKINYVFQGGAANAIGTLLLLTGTAIVLLVHWASKKLEIQE